MRNFKKRSYLIILHDLLITLVSYYASYYLKFGIELNAFFEKSKNNILLEHAIFALVAILGVSIFRTYKAIWKYVSIKDLLNIIKFSTFVILCFLTIMFIINRLETIPRTLFVINWLLLSATLSFPRLLSRLIQEKFFYSKNLDTGSKLIPILLFGINNNTEVFLREIDRDKTPLYKVVGIIDYNNLRNGSYLHNIKIYGDYRLLRGIYQKLEQKKLKPQKIIITDDFIQGNLIRDLFKIGNDLGMTVAKLPKLTDFKTNIDNKIEIKPIVIEDLLGRAQNSLDKGNLFELLNNKKILITGSGGTIGSELTRQIASYNPKIIILVENAEFNLYLIDKEIKSSFPNLNFKPIILDVRNLNYLDKIFAEEMPELVFHAAALKHVPIVEENIIEAASTNIIGTKIVADLSIKYGVKQMLLISTDKAVNPTSLMGATKRVAETYIDSLKSNNITKFTTVRFGNVLGSSGSVIPLFEAQLKAGGPITVTHPDMVRYFMTVREAVELVLRASVIVSKSVEGSYIFVLDMGEPVRIKDLATQIIKMAGLRPNIDIEINYTGIRVGEKLYEELFYADEEKIETDFKSIILVKNSYRDYVNLSENIDAINNAISNYDKTELLSLIKLLVPEYLTTY